MDSLTFLSIRAIIDYENLNIDQCKDLRILLKEKIDILETEKIKEQLRQQCQNLDYTLDISNVIDRINSVIVGIDDTVFPHVIYFDKFQYSLHIYKNYFCTRIYEDRGDKGGIWYKLEHCYDNSVQPICKLSKLLTYDMVSKIGKFVQNKNVELNL